MQDVPEAKTRLTARFWYNKLNMYRLLLRPSTRQAERITVMVTPSVKVVKRPDVQVFKTGDITPQSQALIDSLFVMAENGIKELRVNKPLFQRCQHCKGICLNGLGFCDVVCAIEYGECA